MAVKKLAMLLALCLVATALPGFSAAEDIESALVEAKPDEATGETGAPGLFAEPDEAPASEDATSGVLPDVWSEEGVFEAWEASDDPASVEAAPMDLAAPGPAGGNAAVDSPEAGDTYVAAAEEQVAPAPHTDPNGPQLAANEIALGVGEHFALDPAMPEGVGATLSCASSDEAIAAVTQAGEVSAVAMGDAVVTVQASDGTYAECFVHVRKAPDKVSFSKKKLSIGKGERTELPAVKIGSAEGEYAGACSYKSSNAKVVKVDDGGVVKGLKTGRALITVMTYNGRKATCQVTVVSAPKKVKASVKRDTLGVGETIAVDYELPKGSAGHAGFESDSPAVASVDALTGLVQALSPGKAVVTVKTYNGKTDSVALTVKPAPESLSFASQTLLLGVGMKLDKLAALNGGAAGAISYSVGQKAVAACKNGVLQGVAIGRTVLSAKTYNGLEAQCEVRVLAAPKKVALPYKTVEIGVKQALQLKPSVGKSASTYTYSSSNRKIVKVSSDGVITGVKKGSATVTVRTYNKKTFKLKVKVVSAPGSVSVSPVEAELGVDETLALTAKLPKGTAAGVTYSSSDESVALVDAETGVVTAVGKGVAEVIARTHNGRKASTKITVLGQPEWIEAEEGFMELAEAQSRRLDISLSPGSRSPLTFASQDPAVAAVSADGVVTGVGGGQTVITIGTNVPDVRCEVSVTVWPAPKKVKLETTELTLNVGETTQMVPIIPEGTVAQFVYSTSDSKVAQVSEDGAVLAVGMGSATLTVTTHNGKKAVLKLTVEDPWYPTEVELLNAPDNMKANSKLQLALSVTPSGAIADLEWATTNEAVAYVDDDDVLHTTGFGYAVLSAVSRRNGDIRLEFTLAVETDGVTLAIPARTTDVAGISKNLAMIEAIHTSAVNQLKMLYSGGVISASDASKRKSIIDNAFKDYAFPWMTPKLQKYWKEANSEGGVKDFKPDRVYYGMPYISGSGNNRAYNAAKALAEGRFTDSGKGYYLLNQNKLLSGRYCGNDCSCFVDAAIWGTNSSHSNDRTAEIAVSSAYRTINGFGSMRTGDLICKGYAHVVMFLYYANAEKTKIMIIENGGSEPGTNTVHCIVMDVNYYTSNGYKVRRLASLG